MMDIEELLLDWIEKQKAWLYIFRIFIRLRNIDEGIKKLEVSSVGGTPLSLPDESSDALAISRQHDTSSNQTVSSDSEDVNL